MKKIFIILSLFAFVGCMTESKERINTNNSNFHVELLFEVDGCKVYRFWDGGYVRYFSNCKGNINYTEQHGKTSSNIEIPTN